MQSPIFGEPPSEKTEVFLAFDEDCLYVAGRLYDREPSRIQAPTKKRDAIIGSTEWFGIILDTFNDKENGLGFFTTPSGLRWDGAVFNDAQMIDIEDMPLNRSWNAFWDVAVVRTEEGWFVEMQIPLSSLRFQDVKGRVVMGLLISRWIARKNEMDIFPAVPQNWGQMSNWKPSQAQEIEFIGLRARNPLYVTPYILAGASRTSDLNEGETAHNRTDTPEYELGLDVKYGLTSNLTIDLTINADFAQVEADDAQVNLTRFSLYFPEKRLLFQERSSNFEFSLGRPDRLFYSRRIGLYEGKPVPIYGGARIVGRIGGWDLGILDIQTAPVKGLPSENFGVLRLRRQVFNAFSYVGGILTSRIGQDGSYNAAYGLDAIIRLFDDDYFMFDWAQVFQTGAANQPLSLDPSHLGLTWERRTQIGLGYNLSFSCSGPDFEPGMGFLGRENYTRLGWRALYGWVPRKDTMIYRQGVFIDGQAYWNNDTGWVETVELGPGWECSTKSGWSGTILPRLFHEDVAEEFSLSDEAGVPVGRYTFLGLKGMVMTPQGRLLSSILTLDVGSFYDGWRLSVGAMPTWNAIPDLELSGLIQYNAVRFPGRGQEFVAPLGRIRVLATLSTKFSASAFIQYGGGDDVVAVNLRLRYNPKEGTDVYLVYNEGLNTDRLRKTPTPPLTSDRTLLFKVNYTFEF